MKPLHARERGFSLIEVLVALVIIGVGMLGIAKVQALAYAATGTAALRGLAAIEASSLAAAMRANRDYWTVTAATATQTIQGISATITASTDGTLVGTAAACGSATFASAPAVAAYDVQCWMKSLNAVLPGVTATVICTPPTLSVPVEPAGYPVGCNITINWYERNAAINAQSQGQIMVAPSYTLYVEP